MPPSRPEEPQGVGRLLEPLARGASPFTAGASKPPKGVHFVEPELVAAVDYGDITDTGTLRHPRYKGLRDDLDPADVRYPEEG